VADRLVDCSISLINSIWHGPLPASGNATPPSSQASSRRSRSPAAGGDDEGYDSSSSSSSSALKKDMQCSAAPQLPLRVYVQECLRRSRCSCSTLQAALLYCVRAKKAVTRARLEDEGRHAEAALLMRSGDDDDDVAEAQQLVGRDLADDSERIRHAAATDIHAFDRERGYVLAGDSLLESSSACTHQHAHELDAAPSSSDQGAEVPLVRPHEAPIQFSFAPSDPLPGSTAPPILCGRRMFLVAVMMASKFLQDRNGLNAAWAHLSGLSVTELASMERAFLDAIGYDLNVSGPRAWSDWVVELEIRAAADKARAEARAAYQRMLAEARAAEQARSVAEEMLDLSDCSDQEGGSGSGSSSASSSSSSASTRRSPARLDNAAKEREDTAVIVATANALANAVAGLNGYNTSSEMFSAAAGATSLPPLGATKRPQHPGLHLRSASRLSAVPSCILGTSSVRYSPFPTAAASLLTPPACSATANGISGSSQGFVADSVPVSALAPVPFYPTLLSTASGVSSR